MRSPLLDLPGAVPAEAPDEGVAARVRFLGEIDDDTLIELYANALAVVYPPFDEDFGYVTLEAFLSKKPVITTSDAGEPARRGGDDRKDGVSDGSS